MAGPGKGVLRRFGPQTSSSSHGVPQPQKSSSNRDVPKVHKSSNNRHVPPLNKSSSSRDLPPPHLSSNIHQVPQPQKSSSSHDVSNVSSSSRDIEMENQGLEEDNQEEDQEIDSIEMDISDPQLEENTGSASYGTSVTRKETRVLSETRKRRLNKGQFVFEVDECAGRIVGEDSQRFITKGGCLVREHANFDGTTWRNQSDLLKDDIINKCMKRSAKNKKNRSMNEVPPAVGTVSIARIVDKRRREGEQISAIEQYKIGHFSTKKNKMVNEKADEIWNELLNEEAASSCSPAEICLKKLRRIPGHIKGRAASTKHILATENIRMELELEKNKSKALEEEVKRMKEEQVKFQEEQTKFKEEQMKVQEEQKEMKDKVDFLMAQLLKITGSQN